jgi:hypothetical protein
VELAEAALAVARAVELAAVRALAAALEVAREAAPGAALAEEAQAQAVADPVGVVGGSITPPKTSPGRRSRRT